MSPCGIHQYRRRVERCDLCDRVHAELAAEPLPPLRNVLTGAEIPHPARAQARRQAAEAARRRARAASSNPRVAPRENALRGRS